MNKETSYDLKLLIDKVFFYKIEKKREIFKEF